MRPFLHGHRVKGPLPIWVFLIWDISEINISDIKYLPKCFSFIPQPRLTQYYKHAIHSSFVQMTVLEYLWFKTESVWRDAGCPRCNLLVITSSWPHSCLPSVKLLYSILDRSIFVFRISCQKERGSVPKEHKEISTELTRRPDAAITSSSSNITGSALRRRRRRK